jgi:hypothetical protein
MSLSKNWLWYIQKMVFSLPSALCLWFPSFIEGLRLSGEAGLGQFIILFKSEEKTDKISETAGPLSGVMIGPTGGL